MNHTSAVSQIKCLDGLRGAAAFWVLAGHSMLLTGWRHWPIANADLAVDLFIMLSGFLMAYHYTLRSEKEPWTDPATWTRFWTRRYFRLAPLYYIALVAAFALGPSLWLAREQIANIWPETAQQWSRYNDHSLINVLLHATFTFGFVPNYSFRTALPDWSIGLEMQFYFVFPFIMIFYRRFGVIITTLLVELVCFKTSSTAFANSFPMPSLLSSKMTLFLVGIFASYAFSGADVRSRLLNAAAATGVCCFPFDESDVTQIGIRLLFLTLFICIPREGAKRSILSSALSPVYSFLSTRPMRLLGEVSFGVYLLHLLFLLPVCAWVASAWGRDMTGGYRFSIALLSTAALTYPVAYVCYIFVERCGISVGAELLRRWLAPRPGVATRESDASGATVSS